MKEWKTILEKAADAIQAVLEPELSSERYLSPEQIATLKDAQIVVLYELVEEQAMGLQRLADEAEIEATGTLSVENTP